MCGDPLSSMEGLHGGGGHPDVESFSQQLERHAVIMVVHLDVVIDIDLCLAPLCVCVVSIG